MGNDGSPAWLLAVGAGVLGLALSPIAEILIARLIPRLGGLPGAPTRVMTALIAAALCAAFAFRFEFHSGLPAFILLGVLGVQLAKIDIALHVLPNLLVLALLTGGSLLFLATALLSKETGHLLRSLIGALILFAIYLILAVISPAGIGMGDVKLAAPVGLYLGYLGWNQLLYGGLLGFIFNGVITVLVLNRRGQMQATEVPHGPSMLASLTAAAFFMT